MPSRTLKDLYMRYLVVCRTLGLPWCRRKRHSGQSIVGTLNFSRNKCAAGWDIGHSSDPSICEFVDCMLDRRDGLLVP